MAITRQKKEQVVEELKEAFQTAKISVFTDFKGMDVNSLTDLRGKIRQSGGKYLVAKKTLIRRVLEDKKINEADSLDLDGQIGLGFGFEDSVQTSKIIYQTQKEGKVLKILGGVMGDKILNTEEMVQLAQLPTREELVAKVVGTIGAPLSGFVNVLRGNIQGLIFALKAIGDKK